MAVMVLVAMLFSAVFVLCCSSHTCSGCDCHTCKAVRLCSDLIRGLCEVLKPGLCAALSAVILTAAAAPSEVLPGRSTPVAGKVRMND